MDNEVKKTGKDPKERFISIRMSESEMIELNRILNEMGIKNRTDYIKSCIFSKNIKVQKMDWNVVVYVKMLNNLQAEYRAIGNNYNQATKAIHTAFTEKKALAFLYKLEQATIELIKVNKEIIQLSKEFQEKWLQK